MFWLGPAKTIRMGVTGPLSCCRCVCWLTWVWFIVLLKPWVGQRPGGTEDTSTGASFLMTVKRRRDLSKHLSSLASLLYLCFKLCITAPAQTGKDTVTGQPMNICPRFERPLQAEPVWVGPICCVLLRTKSMGNRRIIPQQIYSHAESFKLM